MVKKLRGMRQAEQENLETWIERVERVAREAKLPQGDFTVKQAFTEGLRDKESQKQAAKMINEPWEKILKKARKEEGAMRNWRALKEEKGANKKEMVAPLIPTRIDIEMIREEIRSQLRGENRNRAREEPLEKCEKCGKTNHKTENCGKIRCYKCGQYGHIARDCPKNPQQRKGEKPWWRKPERDGERKRKRSPPQRREGIDRKKE